MTITMVSTISFLIFSSILRHGIISALSKDDKLVIGDQARDTLFVCPMSLNPDLSTAAVTFSPDIMVDNGPSRVKYSASDHKVYFTTRNDFGVARSNLDGSDAEIIVTINGPTTALALDDDTRKIYFHRQGGMGPGMGGPVILSTDFDGGIVDLVRSLGQDIINMELDKKNEVLYFTDNNGVRRINLDGTGFVTIKSAITDLPYALALDSADDKLYWSDLARDTIEVLSTPDGLNQFILWDNHIDDFDFRAVALYYNNLYVIDSDEDLILRLAKDGSSPAVSVGAIGYSGLVTSPFGMDIIYSPPCVTDTLIPSVSSTNDRDIDLSWTPQSTYPKCEADEYQVSYQPYDLGSCSVSAAGELVTSDWQSTSVATVNNLVDNTYYQISLLSRNLPMDGQAPVLGNSVNIVEPCLANLVLTESPINQQIEVSWSATTCECKASEYRVAYLARDYCGIETIGIMSWQILTKAVLPISGALAWVEVSVTPRKYIGVTQTVGYGRPMSTSRDDITSVPIGSPMSIIASNIAASSFQITWEGLTCDDTGGETLRYAYELTSQFGRSAVETSLKSTSFTDLRCETTYEFRVAAISVEGTGPFSNTISIETLISEEPFESELTKTSTSSQEEISWTPSECPPLTFDVKATLTLRDQCEELFSPSTTNLGSVSSSPVNMNDFQLLPYSTYTVSIVGVGSSGVSVTRSIEVTTRESVPTSAPLNVAVTDIQRSSLSFTWQTLLCRSRNGEVTYQYQLLQQSNVIMTTRTSDTSVALSSLSANTDYEFRVAATTSAGIGPYSSSIFIRTTDHCPPDYCQNGGQCFYDEIKAAISCSCSEGFIGIKCDTAITNDIREADPAPAPNIREPDPAPNIRGPAAAPALNNLESDPAPAPQQVQEIGPGAISAISISAVAGVVGTTAAVGVFIYLLRRAASGAATATSGLAAGVSAQSSGIPLNNLQYPQTGSYGNSIDYGNYGYY